LPALVHGERLADVLCVLLPAQAGSAKVPALFCLAGLTCNEETFATKAGAQRQAAALGLMLITPDTSPRDAAVPG
jgi:S-formylglutathione hydrolase